MNWTIVAIVLGAIATTVALLNDSWELCSKLAAIFRRKPKPPETTFYSDTGTDRDRWDGKA